MKLDILALPKRLRKTRRCLACGTTDMHAGRRYCSKECRGQIQWVLSLSKGLLQVFNARYASFSFNDAVVILDVLPVWSRGISRFVYHRALGNKPAVDLKNLLLDSGKEWYHMVDGRSSRSYASLMLLKRAHNQALDLDTIRPDRQIRPKLSRNERESVKLLKLKIEELMAEGKELRVKSSYKRLAKIYHPDVGGDAEKFKKINAAHEQMLAWAANPQFTRRKALAECWSYDGSTNRWSPPL